MAFIEIFCSFNNTFLKRILTTFIAFVSRSLIEGTFFHLLPEVVEEFIKAVWQYIVVCIFMMENVIFMYLYA
ncbi:MAG: hypothetical protein QXD78_03550 [Candidatus Bathyarchaeia archaeon]